MMYLESARDDQQAPRAAAAEGHGAAAHDVASQKPIHSSTPDKMETDASRMAIGSKYARWRRMNIQKRHVQ